MIVYKDRFFCMQDCGRDECIRNKCNIPWENELPVSFMRCSDCENYISPRNATGMSDFYKRGEEE